MGALARLDGSGDGVSLQALDNRCRFAVMDYGRKKTAVAGFLSDARSFPRAGIEKTSVVAIG